MDSSSFLKQLIETVPDYEVSPDEKKRIQFEGIEKFLYAKLTSSKFKAAALPQEFQQKVKEKISYCVNNSLPIHITIPFGGYKKWQLPTAPLPDWAEVFNFVLVRDYLAPIAKIYKHGVVLEYFSDEIFIAPMNNYPQKDLDQYNEQFEELISYLKDFLPPKFVAKCSKIRDFISQEEILKRFEQAYRKLQGDYESLSPKEKQVKMAKTERNYQGDLRDLSENERQRILFGSYLIHEAFTKYDWDLDIPWAFDKDMIALGFCYTGSWGIHLRSSTSSTVQFWIGTGTLLKRADRFIPTILTYEQYQKSQKVLKQEAVTLFPEKFSNLQSVALLEQD